MDHLLTENSPHEVIRRKRKRRNRNKQLTKGRNGTQNAVGEYSTDDRFGNGRNFPTIGLGRLIQGTLINYNIKIPPLPSNYNKQFRQRSPSPVRTEEEKNLIRIKDLRATRIFESTRIRFPQYLPTKVDLLGLTVRGTVLIRFKDAKNCAHFENLEGRIHMWSCLQDKMGLDSTILKEDLQVGLVVLAKPGKKSWIRAKIMAFDDQWITIRGVDFMINKVLPYSSVYYYNKKLNDCPFQIVECHLFGLEQLEDTPVMEVVLKRMNYIVEYNNFWVTELKEEDDPNSRKYYVKMDFPDDIAKDASLEKCILNETSILLVDKELPSGTSSY